MATPDTKASFFIAEPLAPLVKGLNKGNPQAASSLYTTTLPRISFVAGVMLSHAPDYAEDAVQNYFLDLMERPRLLEPRSNGEIVTFMDRGITLKSLHLRERLVSRSRRYISLQAGEIPLEDRIQEGPSLEELAQESENKRQLTEVLNSLKPEQRQAITLVYLEGYDTNEAATMMGLKIKTLRTHLHRGKQKIREKMANPYTDS